VAIEVEIARLGAQGDGIAEGPAGPLFVPFALPGERVRVEVDADGKHTTLLEVLRPSPDRVAPVCPHFGVCGGCALQQMERHAYLTWKRELVVQALRARGLEVDVDPVRPVPLGSRRRAALSLGRNGQGQALALGYRRARSHDLIDVAVCPILLPEIVGALPGLKRALAPLLGNKREARVGITATETGLDIVVDGVRAKETALAKLAGGAGALGIARITVGGESLTLIPPAVRFGNASVKIAPGAFLQAAQGAEAIMTELVREGVGKAKRLADLFAGQGTFALALADSAAVDAYEADETALAALADAARHTAKLKPVKTLMRDLFGDPLVPKELESYDAVVFDPPRAGAAAQSQQLAKSKVKTIVAVSCNPGTLARDLRILVDGGYRVTRVVPVDQFLFSGHVEVIAHLER